MPKNASIKKGGSFVNLVTNCKSLKALNELIAKQGDFPARNPRTFIRRRRAIKAKKESLAKRKAAKKIVAK